MKKLDEGKDCSKQISSLFNTNLLTIVHGDRKGYIQNIIKNKPLVLSYLQNLDALRGDATNYSNSKKSALVGNTEQD